MFISQIVFLTSFSSKTYAGPVFTFGINQHLSVNQKLNPEFNNVFIFNISRNNKGYFPLKCPLFEYVPNSKPWVEWCLYFFINSNNERIFFTRRNNKLQLQYYRLLRRRSLGRAVATAASGDERHAVGSGHHGPQPGQAMCVQQLLRRYCLPRPLPVPGPLARVRMRVSTYIFLHYSLYRFIFNVCFINTILESCTQHYQVFIITALVQVYFIFALYLNVRVKLN